LSGQLVASILNKPEHESLKTRLINLAPNQGLGELAFEIGTLPEVRPFELELEISGAYFTGFIFDARDILMRSEDDTLKDGQHVYVDIEGYRQWYRSENHHDAGVDKSTVFRFIEYGTSKTVLLDFGGGIQGAVPIKFVRETP